MLRWITLIALVAMVAFVGCDPDSGKADTPDDTGTPADSATDDSAATDDEGLGDLDAEFGDYEVQGGSSASAQRDGGAE